MSFSADAIGFFLQIDDQLSPALPKAEKAYASFVNSLDKLTKRAVGTAQSGFDAITDMVGQFTDLPKAAAKSADAVMKKLHAQAKKPIRQKIILDIEFAGGKNAKGDVQKTLSDALRNARIRMTATAPLKKSPLFDTSVSLRNAYKDLVQPPDLLGRFQNIPKFAKGGEVNGSPKQKNKIDSVLAFLTPGEIVLPKDVSAQLKEMTSRKRLPKGLSNAVANIENLAKGLQLVKKAAATGLDPKAPKIYERGVQALNAEFDMLVSQTRNLSEKSLRQLIPKVSDLQDTIEEFNRSGEEASGTYRNLFEKILGPARFLAMQKAFESVREGMDAFRNASASAFGDSEDGIQTLTQNTDKLARKFRLTREQAFEFTQQMVSGARAQFGAAVSATELGEAMDSLVQQGVPLNELTSEYIGSVALMSRSLEGDAGPAMRQLADNMGLGAEGATELLSELRDMANIGQYGSAMDLINEQVESLDGSMGQFLMTLDGPEARKAALGFQARLGASFNSIFAKTPEVAQGITDALFDVDKRRDLATALGLSPGELKKQMLSGDPGQLVETIIAQAEKASGAGSGQNKVLDALGLGGTMVQTIRARKGELRAAASDLVGVNEDLTGAIQRQTDEILSQTSAMSQLSNWVGGFVSEKAFPFIDAMDGMKVETLAATGHLVLMAGKGIKPLLGFMGTMTSGVTSVVAKLFGWATANTAVATTSTAAGTATKVAGSGATSFFAQLSAGLIALTPAIPVILTLTAAVVGIGIAAKLAEKPLTALVDGVFGVMGEVVGGVLELLGKGLDSVMHLFDSISQMSPSQIFSTAAGLLALGPAFVGLGAGIAGMSALLVTATPGLLAFEGVMSLIGSGVEGGGIAGIVMGIAQAFAVDPGLMRSASENIGMMVTFMGQFAALSAMLAGLAATGLAGDVVNGVLGLFGMNSPLDLLASDAKNVAGVVREISSEFGKLEPIPLESKLPPRAQLEQMSVVRLDPESNRGVESRLDELIVLMRSMLGGADPASAQPIPVAKNPAQNRAMRRRESQLVRMLAEREF